jgi:hypothetical protein
MKDAAGKLFANPAFCEYIFLLVELERLIREGRNEGAEGEALYEEMDAPWDKLDDAERNAIRQFADDLTRMSNRYASILLPTEKSKPSPGTAGDVSTPGDHSTRSQSPGQGSPRELIP